MQVKQRWTNATIVTPAGFEQRDLLIDGERFAGFAQVGESTAEDRQKIDASGQVLFPGMIDLLQHGFDQHLYNDVEQGCVAHNAGLMAAHGVTGFLPSISCLPPGSMEPTLARLAGECRPARGARALGIHSEGPCFGSPGAHNPENIVRPSVDLAERMLRAADGKLKAVTIAPELPGAEPFIKLMRSAGVSVHLGHSNASPQDIPLYAEWGINAVTHMYNVMPGLAPRSDGLPVFSLTDALIAEPSIALGLICDGIHVHPKLVQLLSHLPPDRVFLETDANKYAGCAETSFEFYPGYRVTSAPGKAVVDANGGLCGSSLASDEAMRNYIEFSGKDLVQAAWASSLVPARVLGMQDDIGSIEPGKLADFAVLDAATLAVTGTYVAGEQVFGADTARIES